MSDPIAFLPMASLPDVLPAKQAFWSAVSGRLRDAGIAGVSDTLHQSTDLQLTWRKPELLFSQTCGYPLVLGLEAHVQLVATPVCEAPGCEGAYYSSAVVVRAEHSATTLEELRGLRCAYNNLDSQSGYNALRAIIAPLANGEPFFSSVIESGGHLRSAQALVAGDADVAALDCVSMAQMRLFRPALIERLRVVSYTEKTPYLPFITSATTDTSTVALLRKTLQDVLHDPASTDFKQQLLWSGIEVVPRGAYDVMLQMQRQATALDYPALQ